MQQHSIGICVLTLNAARHLPHCLPPLLNSPLNPTVLVVDSSSNDNSVELASALGAKTAIIPCASFNHGTTREWARHQLNTDIVVMVTQDAYACDKHVLNKLVAPLLEGKAALSYARQIPHSGATLFEAFHRHFNYPPQSELRSKQDIPHLGRQTFFCSNSFAAYRNDALDSIGGFKKVLLGEDTLACAELIHNGYCVAYVAEALVHHSHNYGLRQEFQRHFDIGYARRQFEQVLATTRGDSDRGKTYTKALLKELWHTSPHQIPYGCMVLLTKWVGYQLGKLCQNTPERFNQFFSAHKGFWLEKNRSERL